MEQLAIYTDANRVDMGATSEFYVDLECGTDTSDSGNNTFSIQLPDTINLASDSLVYVDGSEWGGIVHKRVSDTTQEGVFQWEGRTWHGILADKILEPNAGDDYYYANGDDTDCISALITKLGVSDLFVVGTGASATISNYRYGRYVNGFTALVDMLASADLRPTFEITHQSNVVKVAIGATAINTLSELADGELADVEMVRDFRPFNHVIGLGQGELSQRTVIHRYADANGTISTTQTFTGLLERTVVYENVNADQTELIEGAVDALGDLQGQGSVTVEVDEGLTAALGDKVIAYEPRLDTTVTVPIIKQIVKVENGEIKLSCECGGAI